MVFGINNDRTKELTFEQRLTGLDDSDQLKRNIIDQIQNITPNIPIDNLIFRKSNIRLPNKKVAVILKIIKTNVGPHQYDHIFYKRISNGNEPMGVDEIKQTIIESQRNESALWLLLTELGVLRVRVNAVKESIKEKNLESAKLGCFLLPDDSSHHFLYHQSFAYSRDIQDRIYRIVECTKLLGDLSIVTRDEKLPLDHSLVTEMVANCDDILLHVDNLEKFLDRKIIESMPADEVRKLYRNPK